MRRIYGNSTFNANFIRRHSNKQTKKKSGNISRDVVKMRRFYLLTTVYDVKDDHFFFNNFLYCYLKTKLTYEA